jgi:hypothetical protein
LASCFYPHFFSKIEQIFNPEAGGCVVARNVDIHLRNKRGGNPEDYTLILPSLKTCCEFAALLHLAVNSAIDGSKLSASISGPFIPVKIFPSCIEQFFGE